MVRSRFSDVSILETKENIGYGRANNRALLRAPGRYYLILNSDTTLFPGALDLLIKHMDAHTDLGAAGAALLEPDGAPQTDWAVGELTLASVLWEQTFLAKIFPKSQLFGDYFRAFWPRLQNAVIPQACGACLIVRADLFNQVGGFDPLIFMYAEDTDLCKRIRNMGFEIGYIADAKVTHHHGKSSEGELRSQMIFEHNRSRIYYFAKHDGALSAFLARSIMVCGAALRGIIWWGASIFKSSGRGAARKKSAVFFRVAADTAKTTIEMAVDNEK
jgi:GT2 family glycosyltransferase